MKLRDLVAAVVVVAVVGGIIGAYELASRYASGQKPACQNRTLKTLPSPNNNLKAVLFERNCGTATNPSAQVSVLPMNGALTNDPGNAFIADVQGGARLPFVDMKWHSPDGLEVISDPAARIYKRTDLLGDVFITYREAK
jgi:hypothetical protein